MMNPDDIINGIRDAILDSFVDVDRSAKACVDTALLVEALPLLALQVPVEPDEKYGAYWCGGCKSIVIGDPKTHKIFHQYCPRCGKKAKSVAQD